MITTYQGSPASGMSFQGDPCKVLNAACSFGHVCDSEPSFCPRRVNQSISNEFHYSKIKGSLPWASITSPRLNAAVICQKPEAENHFQNLSFLKLLASPKNNGIGCLSGFRILLQHRNLEFCLNAALNSGLPVLQDSVKIYPLRKPVYILLPYGLFSFTTLKLKTDLFGTGRQAGAGKVGFRSSCVVTPLERNVYVTSPLPK